MIPEQESASWYSVSSHAHATFIQLSRTWLLQSAQDRVRVARGGELLTDCAVWARSGRIISVQNGEHSFCSKRRYDEEKSFNGHSFLPAKRGASSVEPPFFWSLGIRGRNQWKVPCFQDWSTSSSFDVRKMLGCCGQIARRWHCLGAQVFVFLAKDKGDSLRVTTLADEKKVRSFTACDDVYAWWPDSGSGAEIQWTTLSQLVWHMCWVSTRCTDE